LNLSWSLYIVFISFDHFALDIVSTMSFTMIMKKKGYPLSIHFTMHITIHVALWHLFHSCQLNGHFSYYDRTRCFFHTKIYGSWHMQGKLCGFIHYSVQHVMFIVIHSTLKWQFDMRWWTHIIFYYIYSCITCAIT